MRQPNGNPMQHIQENTPNSSRPGLQRNSNFNESTASLQSIPINAHNLQPNGNVVNGRSAAVSRTFSQQAPPHTNSGNNSQGHTPAMQNTQSPLINQGSDQKTGGNDATLSQQSVQGNSKQPPGGGMMFQQPGPQVSMQPQFNMEVGGDGGSANFIPNTRKPFPHGQNQNQLQPMLTTAEQMQQEFNARVIKRNLGNAATMRVLDLIDFLSNEAHDNLQNVEFWQRITPAYFLPNSTLRFNFSKSITNESDKSLNEVTGLNFSFLKLTGGKGVNDLTSVPNHFELNTTTAPRFLANCVAQSEFSRFSVFLPGMKFQVLNNGSIIIVSKLEINFTYKDDSISKLNGNVKVLMSRDLRIEWIDVNCLTYESLINLNVLNKQPVKNKSVNDVYFNSKTVQNMSTFGLGKASTRHLQLADVLTHMKQLMDFSQLNNIKSPQRALELLLTTPQATIPTNFQMSRGVPFASGFMGGSGGGGGIPAPQRQPIQFQGPVPGGEGATTAAAAQKHFQQQQQQQASSSSSSSLQNNSSLPQLQALNQQLRSTKQEGQQMNHSNSLAQKKDDNVSSPSPKTVTDEEPRKRRKPSVGNSALSAETNKKRK